MQRIGVFVCWCGSNIAATVDVERVSQALAKEPGVVFSTNYQYMCSQTGQQMIQEKIHEYGLTGVVICSCSPRMHEQTFRKTCEKAGLNPYMVEIANIREQCSWIHKDKEAGTEKAIILGRAAIAKVHLNAPLTAGSSPVTKRALVIGGGIAGIQTALDIAEAGFEVDIVEKQPTIGGKMTQIDKTFPTLDCAACILTPKMVDCAQNEKIHIYSYSEIESVGGFVGNFHVKIRRKARFVKEDVCTGCGLCTEKCPQKKVPNEFNLGMDNRRAIYIPFAQAVPKVATIDPNYCSMLKNGKCGVCAKVCSAGAIDYKQTDTFIEQEYGAIVAATGFNPIDLSKFDEFAYSQSPDVVSSLEFERLMNAAGPTSGEADVTPYIELKSSMTTEQVQTLMQLVEEAGMTDRVVWISFTWNLRMLQDVVAANPEAEVGLLSNGLANTTVAMAKTLQTGQNRVFLDVLHTAVNRLSMQLAAQAGLEVEAYTVNNAELAHALTSLGVVGITTNTLLPAATTAEPMQLQDAEAIVARFAQDFTMTSELEP